MERILIIVAVFLICLSLKAQIKDDSFYQSDTTYSHSLKIITEYTENKQLVIEHKNRQLRVEFELSEVCDEMIIEKQILIEIWRNDSLIFSSNSEYHLPSTCILLPKDSIFIQLEYILDNPWLNTKSKPFIKEASFIIDSILNYPHENFYMEFLELKESIYNPLKIKQLEVYTDGYINETIFTTINDKYFFIEKGDSIRLTYETEKRGEKSVLIKGFPTYGGRFIAGEISKSKQVLLELKEYKKYGIDYNFYNKPHIAIDHEKLNHTANFEIITNRCATHWHSIIIDYIDKEGKVTLKTTTTNFSN